MFWGSKGPKLLLNALFGPQIHALDSIFSYCEYRKWIKRLLHSMWGSKFKVDQSERQNQHFRESEDSVFFPKAGVISQRRKTGFLFFYRKTYKNDTLTTSKPSLCCEVSFKVSLLHPRNQSLTDFSWCAQNWTSFSFSEHFLHKFLSK